MEALPYEVLYKIFTYMPVDELYFNIGSVCSKWRDVAMNRGLWRGKSYRPTKTATDRELVRLLSDANMLEMFDAYERTVGRHVFAALSVNSCNLTEVILSPDQVLDQWHLEKLSLVKNLQSLSLHINDDETAKNNFNILGGFHSLKMLVLTGVFCYRRGVLMGIATGCKCLHKLNLGCLSCHGVTSAVDIGAILKLKSSQLTSLTFTCHLLSPYLTSLIGQCLALQQLHMNIYQSWVFVNFSPLLTLKNLKAFSVLGCLNRNSSLECLFAQHEWTALKCLNLTLSEGNIFSVISDKCTQLRTLRLEGNREADVKLRDIQRLSNLEQLTLAYWTLPIDETILCVSQLKKLKNLCFEHCSELRDVHILDFVMCQGLETINFDSCCGILGHNFHLIVDQLKHLTCLTFINCHNLKTVQVMKLQHLFPHLSINDVKHD